MTATDTLATGQSPVLDRLTAHDTRIREVWKGFHLFRDRRKPETGAVEVISNDYLALGACKEIADAQHMADQSFGNSARMSAVFLPPDHPQHQLEATFAEFLGEESVMLCQSGWTANFGLMQVIASPVTPVYRDAMSHTSLWDGAMAAGAQVYSFLHNDPADLKRLITEHGPGIVVTNAIYNILGDIPSLADICEVAETAGCDVVCDESHALGALGPEGRGVVSELELGGRVTYRTASLAKAFASRGGIIAGPQHIVDLIQYAARSSTFASTLLPHDLAGQAKTLDIIRTADHLRDTLARRSRQLRDGLQEQGFDLGGSSTHLISLNPKSETLLAEAIQFLDARGIFLGPFILPTMRPNLAALRICVHAGLADDDIDRILTACRELRKAVPAPW